MYRRQNGQPSNNQGSSDQNANQWNSNQNQNQWDTNQRDVKQGNSNQGSNDQNQNSNNQNNNQGTSTTQGNNNQGDPNQTNNNQFAAATSTNGNQNGNQNGDQNGNQNGATPTGQSSPTQTIVLLVQTPSPGQNGNQGSNNGVFSGGTATGFVAQPTGQSNNQQQNDNGQQNNNGQQNDNGQQNNNGNNDNNDNNRGGNDSNRGNNNDGDRNNQNDNNNNNNDNHRNQNQQGDNGGGISDGTVKGIAIGASVGGVLILAILFYIFWRRRRGASFSQIARFKSSRASSVLSPQAGNDRMTALPIYRNDRFSVRSSRHDSVTNEAGQTVNRDAAPLRSPLGPEAWKSSHPPKFGSPEALQAFPDSASPPGHQAPTQPQKAHMSSRERSSAAAMDLPAMKESNADNPGLGLFVRHSTDLSGASDNEWPLKSGDSPEDTQNPERWSWSNSNAPPTPRIAAPNARSSLQSNQGRNLAAWLRSQGRGDLPPQGHEPSGGNKPLLKNHATQPVLSPEVPTRKNSKKHGKVGSLAGIFKNNSVKAQSKPNISAPKDFSRPSTANNTIEMNEKL